MKTFGCSHSCSLHYHLPSVCCFLTYLGTNITYITLKQNVNSLAIGKGNVPRVSKKLGISTQHTAQERLQSIFILTFLVTNKSYFNLRFPHTQIYYCSSQQRKHWWTKVEMSAEAAPRHTYVSPSCTHIARHSIQENDLFFRENWTNATGKCSNWRRNSWTWKRRQKGP